MLPTLYKLSPATGKVQQLNISTKDNLVLTTQGQVGGAMQDYFYQCYPKNVGKSNATTADEQAIAEAASKHTKKIKSGYSTDPSGVQTVTLPMKVKAYFGQEKNIIFPCITNIKYNGINATYTLLDDDTLELTSRGGKVYPRIPHLESDVRDMLKFTDSNKLGGELFIEGTSLQTITSYVKKPKPGSENLVFKLFDLPGSTDTYVERSALFANTGSGFVHGCQQRIANSHEELAEHHANAVESGYEGIVIYNKRGLYKYNTRSSDVFKYKLALSAEFKILSMVLDKNDQPVLTLQSDGGVFKAKPKGTVEERQQIVNTFDTEYLNQWGTVEYETLSDDKIPLKPVFVTVRTMFNAFDAAE